MPDLWVYVFAGLVWKLDIVTFDCVNSHMGRFSASSGCVFYITVAATLNLSLSDFFYKL